MMSKIKSLRNTVSIFASMEEFMRSGGKTDLNAQQASDAADFASGGGNFR